MLSNLPNNLINFQQQDAHELFAHIMQSIETVFNNRKSIDLSRSYFEEEKGMEE